MKRLLANLAVLSALLMPGVLQAGVTSVISTPPSTNCSLGVSQNINVNWTVTYEQEFTTGTSSVPSEGMTSGFTTANATAPTPGPGQSVISSTNAVLRAGLSGPVLAPITRALYTLGPTAGGTVILNERLLIPENAITAAKSLGFNLLSVERDFTFQTSTMTGRVVCNITGSGGSGQLNVSRIGLRFPDNSRIKVMAKDENTHVLADISFTGAGRLEAVWELADPASTAGNPSFRTLRLVRRQLIGAGQQITLRSPDLPSNMDGVYLVRFRVTSPELGYDSPVIRYFVNPAQQIKPELLNMGVESPAPGAPVDDTTVFAWPRVPGAARYVVEMRLGSASKELIPVPSLGSIDTVDPLGQVERLAGSYPVSSIMVDANVSALSLTPLAMSRMPAGASYWWRVQAYDGRGRLIGQSQLRSIFFRESVRIPMRLDVSGSQ